MDLEARKEGKKIAVEVETGKSDAIYNVRKDLEAGYDRVLVVCLQEGLRSRVREQMGKVDLAEKGRALIENLKEVLNPTFARGLTA